MNINSLSSLPNQPTYILEKTAAKYPHLILTIIVNSLPQIDSCIRDNVTKLMKTVELKANNANSLLAHPFLSYFRAREEEAAKELFELLFTSYPVTFNRLTQNCVKTILQEMINEYNTRALRLEMSIHKRKAQVIIVSQNSPAYGAEGNTRQRTH